MKKKPKSPAMDVGRKMLAQIHRNPDLHEKKGQEKAYTLFLNTVRDVPAYQAFLREHKVNPRQVKNIEAFSMLPVMDKTNYLRAHPYLDLFPGRAFNATTISATSGSTGEPFYFPRMWEGDDNYQRFSESFLFDQFDIDQKKTLVIVCFGMGMWIAGMSTYTYFYNLARRGLPVTVMPIGFKIDVILSSIKQFGHHYDQVVLAGYPPLIKDILDSGKSEGVAWEKYSLKIITSGEGFTEQYRDYIAKIAGVANSYRDIVGLYGSTELGGMGHETSLSVLIRRLARENRELHKALFGDTEILPTLVQYHPDIVYFEAKDGELLATGAGSSIPLIRYRFPDRGGVLSYKKMISILKEFDINAEELLIQNGVFSEHMKLPFVYVAERSDGVVMLVGANVFPQWIKESLYDHTLQRHITGKFHLSVKEDNSSLQSFYITVELRKGVKKVPRIAQTIKKITTGCLKEKSREYAHILEEKGKRAFPVIVLASYHEPPYFEIGKKHRWLKKLPS